MTAAIADYDNVAGNAYDKYQSRNPIARWLTDGFLSNFDELVSVSGPRSIFEIGCGEGHLSARLLNRGIDVRGCDVDSEIVGLANQQSTALGKGERFTQRSIYDIRPGEIEADLIICCEVLEHLPDPELALDILAMQNASAWLFSVPREPLWRAMNLARGKYVGKMGNTPGHIQHWSSQAFRQAVGIRFRIVERRQPVPWTMLLCTTGSDRAQ